MLGIKDVFSFQILSPTPTKMFRFDKNNVYFAKMARKWVYERAKETPITNRKIKEKYPISENMYYENVDDENLQQSTFRKKNL